MKQPVPIFEGDIVNGKLIFNSWTRSAMARWIQTLKNGTHVDCTIRKHHSKRSNEQNRYYWGVVIAILSEHFGYDPEEMHEEMKLMFNPIPSKIDPSRTIGGSTTKMDTVEFFSDEQSYVERICRWAAEQHEVFIPPPEGVSND